MSHRLGALLRDVHGALLQEPDLEVGLARAVDLLQAGGLIGPPQRVAAQRALEQSIGLPAWRRRAAALAEAESHLDSAQAQLSEAGQGDLEDQVQDIATQVGDLLPMSDDMPREEMVTLSDLCRTFPGVLLEQLLAAEPVAAAA